MHRAVRPGGGGLLKASPVFPLLWVGGGAYGPEVCVRSMNPLMDVWQSCARLTLTLLPKYPALSHHLFFQFACVLKGCHGKCFHWNDHFLVPRSLASPTGVRRCDSKVPIGHSPSRLGRFKASCVSSWVQSEPGGSTRHGSPTLRNGLRLVDADSHPRSFTLCKLLGWSFPGL